MGDYNRQDNQNSALHNDNEKEYCHSNSLCLASQNLSAADLIQKFSSTTNTIDPSYIEKLTLSDNRIFSIPDHLFLNLKRLQDLDLQQCELVHLFVSWDLPALKKLDLSHNCLTSFPDKNTLAGIPKLKHLNLFGNEITSFILPKEENYLTKLKSLNIGANKITSLPKELINLKKLRILEANFNEITSIDREIIEEMNLDKLDVTGNPLFQPPIETCEKGIECMRRYFKCLTLEENSSAVNRSDHEWKIANETSFNEANNVFLTDESLLKKAPPSFEYEFNNFTQNTRGMNFTQSHTTTEKGISFPNDNFLKKSFPAVKSAAYQSLAGAASAVYTPKLKIPSYDIKNGISNIMQERSSERFVEKSREIYLNEDKEPEQIFVKPATDSEKNIKDSFPNIDDVHLSAIVSSDNENVAVNDTLKIIVVGISGSGKSSLIRNLIPLDKEDMASSSTDKSMVGVDIYDWNVAQSAAKFNLELDTRVQIEDAEIKSKLVNDIDIKFSIWDFAGQEVQHSAHELFFSPRALYVIAWDMGVNSVRMKRNREQGSYKLSYESDDEEDFIDTEAKKTEVALSKDIDDKIQMWIDSIQSTNPGAVILPVATFDDCFNNDPEQKNEARRRCRKMRERLLMHEDRKKKEIKMRLSSSYRGNEASSAIALRLRKQICAMNRPKILFGDEFDAYDTIRVSSTQCTGFDRLRRKIIHAATGKDHIGFPYPVFRGHVGTRIPRLVFDVRKVVREMRSRPKNKFFVIEWGHLISILNQIGIDNTEDIIDALQFLSNIGELSFFGKIATAEDSSEVNADANEQSGDVSQQQINPILSRFIFLNPRWLVAAVSCILREDLSAKISEARRIAAPNHELNKVYNNELININFPFISGGDATLLWNNEHIVKKAADRADEYGLGSSTSAYDFLMKLLLYFNIFVPIDCKVEDKQDYYFLPSLLDPGEPSEAWTYRIGNENWKTTLCHSWLFPNNFIPPFLMECITGHILRDLHSFIKCREASSSKEGGQLSYREILCWRRAIFLKLGMEVINDHGEKVESSVEVFVHIVDSESPLCVASRSMSLGMQRLIVSANGQVGDGGKRIWGGGYDIVLKAVEKVMNYFGGLEFEKQAVCPKCLRYRHISVASVWNWSHLELAARNGEGTIRCSHGHRDIETRLVSGLKVRESQQQFILNEQPSERDVVRSTSLRQSVVLIGVWDEKTNRIVEAGSGFIANAKKGLIVTAAHTVLTWDGEKTNSPFGSDYKGLRWGKIVIGVLSEDFNEPAVFRYVAKILAKDTLISSTGRSTVDACVLSITRRLENDMKSDRDWGTQPEIVLENDSSQMKREKLKELKLAKEWQPEDNVRILGFNQGGEALDAPGASVNRCPDFVNGHLKEILISTPMNINDYYKFKPEEEIVVYGERTISGHSGGPCVNNQGEVIGILSRSDPADGQRSYLVPYKYIKDMVKRAKNGGRTTIVI